MPKRVKFRKAQRGRRFGMTSGGASLDFGEFGLKALENVWVTDRQIESLKRYGQKLWADCLTLEKMWLSGALNRFINIEEEELDIARMNPWGGSAAIIASDGLFDFGASPRTTA